MKKIKRVLGVILAVLGCIAWFIIFIGVCIAMGITFKDVIICITTILVMIGWTWLVSWLLN